MNSKTYIVMCKKCGNRMKYKPLKGLNSKSVKKCVYCGKSFRARKRIVEADKQK